MIRYKIFIVHTFLLLGNSFPTRNYPLRSANNLNVLNPPGGETGKITKQLTVNEENYMKNEKSIDKIDEELKKLFEKPKGEIVTGVLRSANMDQGRANISSKQLIRKKEKSLRNENEGSVSKIDDEIRKLFEKPKGEIVIGVLGSANMDEVGANISSKQLIRKKEKSLRNENEGIVNKIDDEIRKLFEKPKGEIAAEVLRLENLDEGRADVSSKQLI